ncbi:MAG: DUF167 domain-containing protein [Methanothrix sp.]|nr:MAG: DUF167 domain-containing protein [Methanothrix sp.]
MENQIGEAVGKHPEGVTIRFEVVPGASKLSIPSGFNPWRQSLEAKLTEMPTRGKANAQLTRELASILKIPGDRVVVIGGQKSSRKTVLVKGADVENVMACLAERGGLR